ncbi:hypothetical protein Leryth_019163 [Lithospermum erythrorhizon]|nr:hypothetical protein Leryth_019163 [Lithospermum erythrorhizon]
MDMETKIKLEEIDGAEGVAPMGLSNNSNRNSLSKPSWLLLTIAGINLSPPFHYVFISALPLFSKAA